MGMSVYAAESHINSNIKAFELGLGATRVIYHPDSNGATLPVSNPQDYPILVQGKVYGEDKKSSSPFIVTPPLFRLNAGQQSQVRIIHTNGAFVPDRESLQWLCVTGIPPKKTDAWAKSETGTVSKSADFDLTVIAHNCIKLFVRPSSLKGSPIEAAANLTWTREGNQISVHNPSPYYMNLSSITVGGKPVYHVDFVAPFAEHSFTLPEGASGAIAWRVITDVGGESRIFQTNASI